MTFEQRINNDLKTAMKQKDEAGKRGIRAIKQAILLAKTDGSGRAEFSDADAITMVEKLIKQRKDSLKIFEDSGRDELARVEREEIEVLQRYLPEQMSDAELSTAIRDIIAQTGASSMKDMGKVMGAARGQLAGRADGRAISTEVKRQLTGG